VSHVEEQLPWFEVVDTLPRHPQSKAGSEPLRHGRAD
jgi:hypothetical protein